MTINESALIVPPKDGLTLVTFAIEDKSICLAVKVDEATFEVGTILSLNGPVKGANFLTGIDKRLDNQRRSIERLLAHLKHHCPALAGKGVLACDYQAKEYIKP